MGSEELSKLEVLIADDEPKLRALLSGAFRSLGCSVIEAKDGDEAWQFARGRKLDVVVLDVMMPGMSGWEVCRRIKTDETWTDRSDGPPKVLMLTGIGEHLNEMTSPLFAADDWIDKPFSLKDLIEKVAAVAGIEGVQISNESFGEMVTEPPEQPVTPPAPFEPVGPGPTLKKARPSDAVLEGAEGEAEADAEPQTVESEVVPPSDEQAPVTMPGEQGAVEPAAPATEEEPAEPAVEQTLPAEPARAPSFDDTPLTKPAADAAPATPKPEKPAKKKVAKKKVAKKKAAKKKVAKKKAAKKKVAKRVRRRR